MRKLIIFLSLLCIGCTYQEGINTIIEENNNTLIGINYPNTNYNNLNEIIKKDVNNIYINFKENCTTTFQKAELNIDYNYTEFENYLSILLDITITTPNYENTVHYIKTYFFNIKKRTLINIKEILSENDLFTIKNDLIKKNININYLEQYINHLEFYINNNNTYIFFSINNEFLTLNYENKQLNFLDKLISIDNTKKVDNFYISNKILDINKKYVAITFDDGPSNYTNDILAILKKYDVNATFFILGNKIEAYQELLKTSLKNGNVIGNHSYNHKWLIKLNEEDIKEQINKTNELIKTYTGYEPTLFRPTYGSINSTIKKITNMDIILWTVDTMDWKYKSVPKIVSRATSNLKDGDIILMHDIYKRSATALDKIIPEIKKQGFEIVTVLELRQIQKMRKYA